MFNRMIKIAVFFVMFFAFCQKPCNAMKDAEQIPLVALLELPQEMIYYILDALDCKTLCGISVVCKTFAVHVKKIKEFRELGPIEDGAVVLRDQVITLPISDRIFLKQFPTVIEGVVTIKCVDKQQHCFSLQSPCVIKSNATLKIMDGAILEFAPRDGKLDPLSIEDGSGGLVVSNATLRTRTGNPDGVLLGTNLITLEGKCYLDASGGMLTFVDGGITMLPNSSADIVKGNVRFI